MKNFVLMGGAGYVAPKHMKAIRETNNNLLAVLDPYDGIGVIDNYFPKADFFTEFERFDRHLEKLKYEKNKKIDFVSICTPNYLHDAHIRMALRRGANAICEKPLVLNPWNIDALSKVEKETGKKINNILQLRLHPSIIALKKKYENKCFDKKIDIDLTYLTSRGNWYYTSWKGDLSKSGGLVTNIGVHFFDMLTWIFGDIENSIVHLEEHDRVAGFLELKNARVRWFLSINEYLLPSDVREKGQRTFRSIKIDNKELEFSDGFSDLHTNSYKEILKGNGFGIAETRQSIEVVYDVRNSTPVGAKGDYHPLVKKELVKHPFLK